MSKKIISIPKKSEQESFEHKQARALEIIKRLQVATQSMTPTMSQMLKEQFDSDPFVILISCLLSLRARDSMTYPISLKLFETVRTPQQLLGMKATELEHLLKPLGFYRKKAALLFAVCKELIERFDSTVPRTMDGLLSIKGVGPKTANLVLGQAFDIPALCVDTHVHRVSNRLGLVTTKTPEQTEKELKKLLPEKYWTEINSLLVIWGQNICVPISPKCSVCVLNAICPKKGVTRSR